MEQDSYMAAAGLPDHRITKNGFKSAGIRSELAQQLRGLTPVLFLVYAPSLLILFTLAVIKLMVDIPIEHLTRDPSGIMGAPVYTGLLSNVGLLFWCSAAAVSLFSYATLQKSGNAGELSLYLLFFGLLTALLLLDDLFLLHETVFPKYAHISEKAVYAGYGLLVALGFGRFRRTLLETEFLLLIFAFGFFGLSMLTDISALQLPGGTLFEDGSKFLGIMSWFTYSVRTPLQEV